jgi:hypothetical protein
MLADVEPGAVPQKAKVDVLALAGQILDRVVQEPADKQPGQDQHDHLDRIAPIARVVEQLA